MELHDLSSTCESGDLTDSLIKDMVVLGIKGLSIKDRLLRTKDLTLDKAIEVCRTAEITKFQLEGICSSSTSHEQSSDINRIQTSCPRKSSWQSQGQNSRTTADQLSFLSEKRNAANHNSTGGHNFNQRRNKKVKSICLRCGYDHQVNKCPTKGKECLSVINIIILQVRQ